VYAESVRLRCSLATGGVELKAEAPLLGKHGFDRLVVHTITATSADGTQAR